MTEMEFLGFIVIFPSIAQSDLGVVSLGHSLLGNILDFFLLNNLCRMIDLFKVFGYGLTDAQK